MKTLSAKSLVWVVMALGLAFLAACNTSRTSNQPWDRPVEESNHSGYNTPDPFPLDRGSKGTNSN